MREIKFRAWDYDDKKMWKVVAISESIWGDCEEKHIRVCDFDKSPSLKETDVRLSVNYKLMQYTGLKDKNGREIYEGDVLFHPIQGRRKVYYPFAEHVASYGLRNVENGMAGDLCDSQIYEIIGNLYENPELLEVNK